jgi:menaquinone-dependent protoporphyrinogen oxidase
MRQVADDSPAMKEPTMPHVLVLYASKHGHTAKIAHRIAGSLRDDGTGVDVRDSHLAAGLTPSDYDGVIVGASIHAGHHQREIVDWAKKHAGTLSGTPSAFFSVCLSVADDTDESRAAARKYIDDFEDETGWSPDTTTTFAGALQYLEYDFMTRLLIKLMMRHQGHPTDTSRDFDYTDWDAVERFGHEFAAKQRLTAARPPGTTPAARGRAAGRGAAVA